MVCQLAVSSARRLNVMIYDIVSVCLTKEGKYLLKDGKLVVQVEEVDTSKNELFRGSDDTDEIFSIYEEFWKIDKQWKRGQCWVLMVIPKDEESEEI